MHMHVVVLIAECLVTSIYIFNKLYESYRHRALLTDLLVVEAGLTCATVRWLVQEETDLMYHTCHNHTTVVKHLIELGCNVNALDKYHKTALDYAFENKHSDLVQILMDAGGLLGQRFDCRPAVKPKVVPQISSGTHLNEPPRNVNYRVLSSTVLLLVLLMAVNVYFFPNKWLCCVFVAGGHMWLIWKIFSEPSSCSTKQNLVQLKHEIERDAVDILAMSQDLACCDGEVLEWLFNESRIFNDWLMR